MEHAAIGREGIFMAIEGGKKYTVADIEALPEGERADWIRMISGYKLMNR